MDPPGLRARVGTPPARRLLRAGPRAASAAPPASVVTVHDLGYEHFPAAHPRLQGWYLRLTTRWHVLAARALLADSKATRDDLVARYRADPAKITVVYPGIDPEHFQPVGDPAAVAAVQARYELPQRYFLYVGTLQPRKNLARLIEAFAAVASPDPELGLVLAGQRGWLYEGLVAHTRRLGLEGRVHFPGYVPDQALPALLSGAVAFVYPSLFEGFGLPILEAQACRTPVLTSTTSSCPEVAGEAALLVPPTDVAAITAGLRRLLTEPGLRMSLVERGAANVTRFTWAQAAAATLAVLEGTGDPDS
ncbi:MAG: glycosyltransferase family 4 protein [Ardenticatenaceae bacterium]|nr:glycosyltransferase family 4 protein [Ardenticatenaceae bacterium]